MKRYNRFPLPSGDSGREWSDNNTMSDTDTMTVDDALTDLAGRPGRQIVTEDHARQVAAAFGVELDERPGELQPLRQLDRLQPDADTLGIGVGDLCRVLAERIEHVEAESFTALGHGTTQDGLKARNLPALREVV